MKEDPVLLKGGDFSSLTEEQINYILLDIEIYVKKC